MKRVASLYLPDWSIDRLRRAERISSSSDSRLSGAASESAPDPTPLIEAADAERAVACSVPRGGGWRPGARWARPEGVARAELATQIAALPAHQRPPMRDLGRRSEAADPPFRATRRDDAPRPVKGGGVAAAATVLPLVTSLKDGSRLVIAAACPAARRLGLAPGMAITQARALVPDLDVRAADPEGDRADLLRLALTAARRWTPLAALSGEDGLSLDITGAAHLFGGEARMARRIVALLARLGVTARIAVADTLGAAWATARFGICEKRRPDLRRGDDCVIVPPGAQAETLASLPLAALRLEADTIDALQHLGVETIGQLAAMPRAPFARRFGDALVTRLDQASGRVGEPLDPVIPETPIMVEQSFVEPIATAEAIEHWLARLMPRLVTALTQAGKGARRIELMADRIDGVPQRLVIGLARPSRDAAHMLRLITRRIAEIAPGYGIDGLALHVRRADPLGPQPLDERLEERPADIAPLVDTLANRIGDARLWRMRPVESDVPERSLASAPALAEPPALQARLKPEDVRQLDRTAAMHPWHHRWPRPVRLLRHPEVLDHVIAELPDQPPRRFTWRGETHRIVRADGPERILGEWWQRSAEANSVRDYFRVEDEAGHRFWLFRRGDGERAETGDLAWFIHGAFG